MAELSPAARALVAPVLRDALVHFMRRMSAAREATCCSGTTAEAAAALMRTHKEAADVYARALEALETEGVMDAQEWTL